MSADRYARQIALFGTEGQRKLGGTRVVIVGNGGVGSPIVQQLALLGVAGHTDIDRDKLDGTNRNREVGAVDTDPDGTPKVAIMRRMSLSINGAVQVETIEDSFISPCGFAAIRAADWIFGCVDRDGVRQVLMELCAAYEKPYIDVATEVIPPKENEALEYGGRVFISLPDRPGCLSCLNELDREEVSRDLADPEGAKQRAAIYGVPVESTGGSGPSVGCINGVLANLAVVEFMVAVTGLRAPNRFMRYRGSTGRVTLVTDEPVANCYYCALVRGKREAADVEHYIRDGVGAWL